MKEHPPYKFQKVNGPLQASIALGQVKSIKEARILDSWVIWLEQRPEEGGRTTALIRPWGESELASQELTPAPINLRSRVHGYGGGVLTTSIQENEILLAWVDSTDGCLWSQSWSIIHKTHTKRGPWLRQLGLPKRLSRQSKQQLADGLIDHLRERWIGVMEANGKDFLVSFSLKEKDQIPKVLLFPKDFAGYATLSPDGQKLAWVEWQQPSMPWDKSQLWLAQFDAQGEIKSKSLIAGDKPNSSKPISIFQPLWLSTGELIVAEDSNDWWNLMVIGPNIPTDGPFIWRHPWPMLAEAAMPQWVYGMRTTTTTGKEIIAAICERGKWALKKMTLDGQIKDIDQPFHDIASLDAQSFRAVAIASNSTIETGLLEIDLTKNTWWHKPVNQALLKQTPISIGEDFWFQGYGNKKTHAWYYPPTNENKEPAPLLVKSHSGPTGMARSGLNRIIQYWTSRGWGVVDVNYGGSSGFGRLYRERINYGWGIVDVFDCANAAKALIALGKADKQKIAIEGGSAAGFTTLACLCFTDIFKVGACKYAVSDLTSMIKDTHRFELGYLDNLVGEWPKEKQRYLKRSPLFNARKIKCPVIFFQGLKDTVVSPPQTELMAEALIANKIPVEVHKFPEEGHGFKDNQTLINVLEATDKFFSKYLNL